MPTDYTPDVAPEPETWLSLDEQARISAAIRAHAGRFPDALHTADANPMMHASLHAILETQIASGTPGITGQTLARLELAGLRRHAAIHAVMRILAEHLAALSSEGARFDQAAWARDLAALRAADIVGAALGAPEPETPHGNRAERRAKKRKRR